MTTTTRVTVAINESSPREIAEANALVEAGLVFPPDDEGRWTLTPEGRAALAAVGFVVSPFVRITRAVELGVVWAVVGLLSMMLLLGCAVGGGAGEGVSAQEVAPPSELAEAGCSAWLYPTDVFQCVTSEEGPGSDVVLEVDGAVFFRCICPAGCTAVATPDASSPSAFGCPL